MAESVSEGCIVLSALAGQGHRHRKYKERPIFSRILEYSQNLLKQGYKNNYEVQSIYDFGRSFFSFKNPIILSWQQINKHSLCKKN
jgi:hypothetical protein